MLHALLALILLLFALPAAAQTFPPLTGRVVDQAGLLSTDQVQQLTQLSDEIEKASSRQFVVATVNSLEDNAIEDYGYKLGRAWKIGQEGANNGIILLVAPNERKVRIEVGYGLEPIMTDALANQIIQTDILPRFKSGDMGGGIVAGAQAIGEQMKAPLEQAEQKAKAAADARSSSSSDDAGAVVGAGMVVFFILIFFILPMIFRSRRYGRRYRHSGLGEAILWGALLGGNDRSSGGSWGGDGGGWGGGGGGGGGFSGGGGSFGGGGASGGW